MYKLNLKGTIDLSVQHRVRKIMARKRFILWLRQNALCDKHLNFCFLLQMLYCLATDKTWMKKDLSPLDLRNVFFILLKNISYQICMMRLYAMETCQALSVVTSGRPRRDCSSTLVLKFQYHWHRYHCCGRK